MQTLILIRHAIAEDRDTWNGDDDGQRPLTKEGRKQAKRIAKVVMKTLKQIARERKKNKEDERSKKDFAIVSLRSSPSLRCIETVEPLAERADVKIDVDRRLLEGRAIKPPSPRVAGAHILCAHGDNIPWLLDELKINWNGRCKKGSIWFIQRDAQGKVLKARYESVKGD
jgi:phosphohistidine phosphatase SixA